MKTFANVLIILGSWFLFTLTAVAVEQSASEKARLAELDAFWAEVSRTVAEGDFKGYSATCHKEGALVSGSSQTSQPLAEALARWKKDFVQTKSGKVKAKVEFRFSQRIGDKTTAHETGMFLYTSVDSQGARKLDYIHLEALLVKKGPWKTMMEYQKSTGTADQWAALK